MRFAFSLETVPVPKERVRVVRGGSYTPKRVRDYERSVRLAAMAYAPKGWDKTGPMQLTVRMFTRRAYVDSGIAIGDVDNLAKSVLDAMNGVAYGDDSQVVDLQATKAVDRARPRVEVEVRRV